MLEGEVLLLIGKQDLLVLEERQFRILYGRNNLYSGKVIIFVCVQIFCEFACFSIRRLYKAG